MIVAGRVLSLFFQYNRIKAKNQALIRKPVGKKYLQLGVDNAPIPARVKILQNLRKILPHRNNCSVQHTGNHMIAAIDRLFLRSNIGT